MPSGSASPFQSATYRSDPSIPGRVSAIILANNRPLFVGRAIESALTQDYADLEVIVVQDSDNAAVETAVRMYADANPRVRYFRNPRPGNIAQSSNYAIEQSKAEYIAILDDDDEWIERTKTSLQVSFLKLFRDHVAVGAGVVVVDKEGRQVARYRKPGTDEEIRACALRANPIANSTAMFRRDTWNACGRYDELIGNFHDWEFWLRFGLHGRLGNLQEYVLQYRLWEQGSSWARMRGNAMAANEIIARYRGVYPGYKAAWVACKAYGAFAALPPTIRKPLYVWLSTAKKKWSGRLRRGAKSSAGKIGIRSHDRHELRQTPTVSVLIPARNEAQHIRRVLRAITGSSYPAVVQAVVVDGGSTDGTQAIVAEETVRDPRVRLVPNPFGSTPHGLNIGLTHCTGEVIIRMDAHSEYSPDYIGSCVAVLRTSGADNVGGAQRFVAQTPFQACSAIAASTIFGSGGARYRNPNYNGFVDTVYLGAFRSEALKRAAKGTARATAALEVFSEVNKTNQDAELNARIRTFGFVYQSSRIVCYYYPRGTLGDFINQYVRYGRGRMITSLLHRAILVRGNAPFLVIWLLALGIVLSVVLGLFAVPVYVMCALLGMVLADAAWHVIRTSPLTEIWRGPGRAPPVLVRVVGVALLVICANIAHATGFCYQTWRILLRRKLEW